MSKSTGTGYDARLVPALKRLHWPEAVPATAKTPESAVCKRCRSIWPCDVSQVLNVVDIQNDALERIYRQCAPGAGECTDCERAQRWAARAALADYPRDATAGTECQGSDHVWEHDQLEDGKPCRGLVNQAENLPSEDG